MHFHIGAMEFLVFVAYYFILKAILLVINLECRRSGHRTSAGVTGLLA
jgi:hypothetical protein